MKVSKHIFPKEHTIFKDSLYIKTECICVNPNCYRCNRNNCKDDNCFVHLMQEKNYRRFSEKEDLEDEYTRKQKGLFLASLFEFQKFKLKEKRVDLIQQIYLDYFNDNIKLFEEVISNEDPNKYSNKVSRVIGVAEYYIYSIDKYLETYKNLLSIEREYLEMVKVKSQLLLDFFNTETYAHREDQCFI